MAINKFTLKAKVWLYPSPPDGGGRWYFLTLPKKQSNTIKKIFGEVTRGWGSLPVVVTIGKTSWKTSIFPDKKKSAYLLPLKADVRKKENIKNNQTVNFTIEIKV